MSEHDRILTIKVVWNGVTMDVSSDVQPPSALRIIKEPLENWCKILAAVDFERIRIASSFASQLKMPVEELEAAISNALNDLMKLNRETGPPGPPEPNSPGAYPIAS